MKEIGLLTWRAFICSSFLLLVIASCLTPIDDSRPFVIALPLLVWGMISIHLVFLIGHKWHDFRARQRRLPGHCVFCGYCLIGNISGLCPECGRKAIASKTSN